MARTIQKKLLIKYVHVFAITLALVTQARAAAPTLAQESTDDAAAIEQKAFDFLNGSGEKINHPAAIREFELAATLGRPVSQWKLAGFYAEGDGVRADPIKSFEFALAAAKQAIAPAQTIVGWSYLTGSGVKGNAQQALSWLKSAAQQDDGHAYYLLSQIYFQGEGVDVNHEFAEQLLTRAAELGFAPAYRQLGWLLLSTPDRQPVEVSQWLHLLHKGVAANDSGAAYLLGRIYLSGTNVLRQPALARKWFSQAADNQFGLAQFWLSEIYAKGLGAEADPTKANQLLEQALRNTSPGEMNDFAWELSVNKDPTLRNGPLAIRVMNSVLTGNEARRPAYLDTMAAAYAEVGDYDAAVSTQLTALEALPKEAVYATMKERMRERLADYRAHKSVRE